MNERVSHPPSVKRPRAPTDNQTENEENRCQDEAECFHGVSSNSQPRLKTTSSGHREACGFVHRRLQDRSARASILKCSRSYAFLTSAAKRAAPLSGERQTITNVTSASISTIRSV